MGEVELLKPSAELIIRSVFILYGDAASSELAIRVARDVDTVWNEPAAKIEIRKKTYQLKFLTDAYYQPMLTPETVWYNDDAKLNFFRIEEFADGNISFVDGIGSNTGYFKLDNLLQTPTTVAHEYGHTIGLEHPRLLDVRGKGIPGIMYPRGTLCDPPMQYDPLAEAGAYGGVMNPAFRKVLISDIEALNLHKLDYNEAGIAKIGEFSSFYHQKHTNPDINK